MLASNVIIINNSAKLFTEEFHNYNNLIITLYNTTIFVNSKDTKNERKIIIIKVMNMCLNKRNVSAIILDTCIIHYHLVHTVQVTAFVVTYGLQGRPVLHVATT